VARVRLPKEAAPHKWQKGQSGNPNGRPKGAKDKLKQEVSEAVLKSMELAGNIVPDLPKDKIAKLIGAAGLKGPEALFAWMWFQRTAVMGRIVEKHVPNMVEVKSDGSMEHKHYHSMGELVDAMRERGLPSPERIGQMIDVTPNKAK
jgi:hypothetical protein